MTIWIHSTVNRNCLQDSDLLRYILFTISA